MVYHSGAVGIVPSQGSYVDPVAIPGQEGCEMVAVDTSRPQERQCSWV